MSGRGGQEACAAAVLPMQMQNFRGLPPVKYLIFHSLFHASLKELAESILVWGWLNLYFKRIAVAAHAECSSTIPQTTCRYGPVS